MKILAPAQFQYPSASKRAADIIAKKLQKAGYQALYVGGWVRDLLMKRENDDIDIATDATPEQLLHLFPKAIQVGIAFGVIRLIVDNIEFEIASFRKDGLYIDGRHPKSIEQASSAEEDAMRRDFSINGLFYDPLTNTILDYVGGIKDLQEGIIRTIGDPIERFSEDRLRVLRAIRFKNRFNYLFDSETWRALQEMSIDTIAKVSPERVWQELEKMARKKILGASLRDMRETSLFYQLFPSLQGISPDYITGRMAYIDSLSVDLKDKNEVVPSILLSLLIPPELADQRLSFIEKFHLSKENKKALSTFSKVEKLLLSDFANISEREIVSCLSLRYALDICFAFKNISQTLSEKSVKVHNLYQELHFWIVQLIHRIFHVSGEDFIARGVSPGKKIGYLIEKAFSFSLNHREKNKNRIIEYVLEDEDRES